LFFLFTSSVAPSDLHSFPTRRSSDLALQVIERRGQGLRGYGDIQRHDRAPPNSGHALQQTRHRRGAIRLAPGHLDVPLNLRHLRSEEHTSELQSQSNLVCRLLLEKKK